MIEEMLICLILPEMTMCRLVAGIHTILSIYWICK
jgi:hypothetical protein